MTPIRWAILGCGKIASRFAEDIVLTEGSVLQAVGARNIDRATCFAEQYGATSAYGTYDDLIHDPDVDVVYIATPHVFHREHTLLAISGGKHVLCEKPLGMSFDEVQQMHLAAERAGVLLMEAMWTRFLPSTLYVLELIASGKIGEVRRLTADFGFKAASDPALRLYNKSLGGGSLLDIGIYPAFLSLAILGMPSSLSAEATFSDTGIDVDCSVVCRYDSGAVAELTSTFLEVTPCEAIVHGSKGVIKMHTRFHETEVITLIDQTGTSTTSCHPITGHGYYYEIKAVTEAIQSGPPFSTLMTPKNSMDLAAFLDRIRGAIDLSYS